MDEEVNGPEQSADEPTPIDERGATPKTEWDSDEALEFLKEEKAVFGDKETNIELTRRLIEEAAPMAALSMVHLARHAQNENTKMNASKWIVEFATQIETEDGKARWEKLLPSIVDEAEKITAGAVNEQGGPATTTYEIGD